MRDISIDCVMEILGGCIFLAIEDYVDWKTNQKAIEKIIEVNPGFRQVNLYARWHRAKAVKREGEDAYDYLYNGGLRQHLLMSMTGIRTEAVHRYINQCLENPELLRRNRRNLVIGTNQ